MVNGLMCLGQTGPWLMVAQAVHCTTLGTAVHFMLCVRMTPPRVVQVTTCVSVKVDV